VRYSRKSRNAKSLLKKRAGTSDLLNGNPITQRIESMLNFILIEWKFLFKTVDRLTF